MRRKDREIKDKKEIESIIRSSNFCRIALSLDDIPYIVPVCFGYEDNCLYFHSAKNGKKIDIIENNNNICFELDIYNGIIKSGNPCDWDIKYHTVIGYGKAYFIEEEKEKIKALNIIVKHYSDDSFTFGKIDNVAVIKVEIEEICGKKSNQ